MLTMVEINHNQHPTADGCEWVYRRMQWAEWTNRQAAQTGVVKAKQGAWADGSQTRGARWRRVKVSEDEEPQGSPLPLPQFNW